MRHNSLGHNLQLARIEVPQVIDAMPQSFFDSAPRGEMEIPSNLPHIQATLEFASVSRILLQGNMVLWWHHKMQQNPQL